MIGEGDIICDDDTATILLLMEFLPFLGFEGLYVCVCLFQFWYSRQDVAVAVVDVVVDIAAVAR